MEVDRGVCDLWPATVTLVDYKLKQQLCNHLLLPPPPPPPPVRQGTWERKATVSGLWEGAVRDLGQFPGAGAGQSSLLWRREDGFSAGACAGDSGGGGGKGVHLVKVLFKLPT